MRVAQTKPVQGLFQQRIYYLFCSLFNAVSNSYYKALNNSMIMNSELEEMWKKAVTVLFMGLSQYLPGWTEEKNEKPQNSYVLAEIQTRELSNVSQKCFHLSKLGYCKGEGFVINS